MLLELLKRAYTSSVSAFLKTVAKTVGSLHSPWTKKYIKYDDVIHLREILRQGDIILTRTDGELSTLVIPGFWKHAEVYIGGEEVIGAVAPKVRKTWLTNLAMGTDNLVALRLIRYTEDIGEKVVEYAVSQLGKEYDFSVRLTDDKEDYCSEIVFNGVNKAFGKNVLESVDRLGYPSFSPDDIWDYAVFRTNPVFEVLYLKCENVNIQKDFSDSIRRVA